MAPNYSVNAKGPAFEATREFIITYILTFACIILFMIPFKIHFAHILWNLHQLHIFIGIFVQPLHIGHIIIGLYWATHETGQFQVPMPKTQDKKPKQHQIQPLLVLPPQDMYLNENQARHTVIIQNDSLPTPSFATQPERKETQHHQQGKKLRYMLTLLWTPLLARSHLYWGSCFARIPSYKA